jgi:hypothetical protein
MGENSEYYIIKTKPEQTEEGRELFVHHSPTTGSIT